jgi:hypothetical protein
MYKRKSIQKIKIFKFTKEKALQILQKKQQVLHYFTKLQMIVIYK